MTNVTTPIGAAFEMQRQSIEQLAMAGTETVAETAEVSESRANEWITSAQSQS